MSERIGSLGTIARVLGIALVWLAAEAALAVLTIPDVSLPDLGTRLVEVAPWHVALFAGLAAAIAALGRLQPLSRDAVTWLALGGGAFTFTGARVVERLIRSSGPGVAAVGALGVGLGVAGVVVVLAMAATWTPRAVREAVTRGLQLAFLLGFVLLLDRIGPEIGEGSLDLAGWLRLFTAGEVARVAAVAIGVALVTGADSLVAHVLGLALASASFLYAVAPGPPAARAAASATIEPIRAPAPTSQPDVIVLLLDTVRADHVGARDAQGRSLTPSLDALAADAVSFPHAYAPSNWTRGSMPALLASVPFAVTGNVASESLDLMAEHLQRAGWHAWGISANPLIDARLGWAQGFERFVDPETMGDFLVTHILQVAGAALPGAGYRIGAITNSSYFRAATELRRRAARMLDDAPRPTFLYVQAMDPHGPYLPPHADLPPDFDYGDVTSYYAFMKLRGQGQLGTEAYRPALENFRQRYAGSVHYLDSQLGELVAKLRADGRYDETLIWVLADHGEAFGEHDWAGHTGLELGPALLHVPLLVKPPKSWGIAPRVEPTAVSTASLLPTTLALLGLPPANGAFGDDISALVRGTPDAAPRTLFADTWQLPDYIYAAIRWPWKLVVMRGPHAGVRGLYDLTADPAEDHSVADLHPEIVATLEAQIEDYRARIEKARGSSGGSRDVDAATQEQLRRLGYVQ